MAKKKGATEAILRQAPETTERTVPKPPEIANLLLKADELLQAGEPEKALDLLARSKTKSPWVTNAMGVCQLRLGNAATAVDVFRRLVLAAGGIHFREDAPVVFKTNFAVALLQSGNMDGCVSALADIREEHPAVEKLLAAIDRFKKNLTFWERINWYMGVRTNRPAVLDFPPGDLQ